MNDWWRYENLKSGAPYDWSPAGRGDHPYDNIDFHLDLGMGTLKKGRLGIDRHAAPGVDLVIDLETLSPPVPFKGPDDGVWAKTMEQYAHVGEGSLKRLPFPDSSIESIISHHCMEHLTSGAFVALIDECHRVLVPGGILRVIVPLFPSKAAVEDPDHKMWIMEGTFETFCGAPDGSHWHEGFSVPYTDSRFELVHKDTTAGLKPRESWGDPDVDGLEPDELWGPKDVREIRVALRKYMVMVEEDMANEDQVHEGRASAGGDDLALGAGPAEVGGDRDLAGVA